MVEASSLRRPRAGGGRRSAVQREAESDQIMRWSSDDGLIEIANLSIDPTVGVRQRTEVSDVTITADPDGRALGDLAGGGRLGVTGRSVRGFWQKDGCEWSETLPFANMCS